MFDKFVVEQSFLIVFLVETWDFWDFEKFQGCIIFLNCIKRNKIMYINCH